MAEGSLIRPAGPHDAARLHAVLASLSDHLGLAKRFRAQPEDYERHGLGRGGLFRALLAEAGGEVCGAATYFPEFSTLRGRPGVCLQDLWVAEARRGSGLGRRLLGAVLRDAADWQPAYMKLATHVFNPQAIAFYRCLGFSTDPDEMTFAIEGAPLARLQGEA